MLHQVYTVSVDADDGEVEVLQEMKDLKLWLERTGISIIEELVGPKMHVQLVERSVPLLKRLAKHNVIDHNEIKKVWDSVVKSYGGTASETAVLQKLFTKIIEAGSNYLVVEGFRLLESSLDSHYSESVSSLAKLYDSARFSRPDIPDNDEHLVCLRLVELCWNVIMHSEAPAPVGLDNQEVEGKQTGKATDEKKSIETCLNLLVRVVASLASENRWFTVDESDISNTDKYEPFMHIIHRVCDIFSNHTHSQNRVLHCLVVLEKILPAMHVHCVGRTEEWLKRSFVITPVAADDKTIFPDDDGYPLNVDCMVRENGQLYDVGALDEDLFARLLNNVNQRSSLFQHLVREMELYLYDSDVQLCFMRPRLGFIYSLMRYCSSLRINSAKIIELWNNGFCRTWRSRLCFWEWLGYLCGKTLLQPSSAKLKHMLQRSGSETSKMDIIDHYKDDSFLSDDETIDSDAVATSNSAREDTIDGRIVDSIFESVTGTYALEESPVKMQTGFNNQIKPYHFYECDLESSIMVIQSLKHVTEQRDGKCSCSNCLTAKQKLHHWLQGSLNEGDELDRIGTILQCLSTRREQRIRALFDGSTTELCDDPDSPITRTTRECLFEQNSLETLLRFYFPLESDGTATIFTMQQFLTFRAIFFWLNACMGFFRLNSVKFVPQSKKVETTDESMIMDLHSPPRSPQRSPQRNTSTPEMDESNRRVASESAEDSDSFDSRLLNAGTAPLLEKCDCVAFDIQLKVPDVGQLYGYNALLTFATKAAPSISLFSGQILVSLHLCCERMRIENQAVNQSSYRTEENHTLVGHLLNRIERERSYHENECLKDALAWRCVYNCARIVHVVEQYVKAVESLQLTEAQRAKVKETSKDSQTQDILFMQNVIQKSFESHSDKCGTSLSLFSEEDFNIGIHGSRDGAGQTLEEILYMIGDVSTQVECNNPSEMKKSYGSILKMMDTDSFPSTALCFSPISTTQAEDENTVSMLTTWIPPLELDQTAYEQLFSVLELHPSSTFQDAQSVKPSILIKPVSQRVWALLMRLQTSPSLEEAMEHPSDVDWKTLLEGSSWRTLYALQAVVGRLYQFGGNETYRKPEDMRLSKTKSTIGWQSDFVFAGGLRIVISQFLRQSTQDVHTEESVMVGKAIAETALRVICACSSRAREEDIVGAVEQVVNVMNVAKVCDSKVYNSVWFLCSRILDMVQSKCKSGSLEEPTKHQRYTGTSVTLTRPASFSSDSEEQSDTWFSVSDSFQIIRNLVVPQFSGEEKYPTSKLAELLLTVKSSRHSLFVCLSSNSLRLRRATNQQIFFQSCMRSVLSIAEKCKVLLLPRSLGEYLLLESSSLQHSEDSLSVLCESFVDCYRLLLSDDIGASFKNILLPYGKSLLCFMFLLLVKFARSVVIDGQSINHPCTDTMASEIKSSGKRPLLSESSTTEGLVHVLNSMASLLKLVSDSCVTFASEETILNHQFSWEDSLHLGVLEGTVQTDFLYDRLQEEIGLIKESPLWQIIQEHFQGIQPTYGDVLVQFSMDVALQFTPRDNIGSVAESLPLCKSNQERSAGYGFLRVLINEVLRSELVHNSDTNEISSATLPFTKYIMAEIRRRTKSQETHDTSWSHSCSRQSNVSGYVGLVNLGCTCYINSVIQQLFMCPPFRQLVLSAKLDRIVPTLPSEDFSATEHDTDPAQSIYKQVGADDLHESAQSSKDRISRREWVRNRTLLLELQKTFLWLSEATCKAYDPSPFLETLDVLGLPHPVFHQNDASELCEKLVDALEQRLQGAPQVKVLRSLFGGSIATERIRQCCGYTTKSESPFVYLELPVSGHSSVEESLMSQFKPEMLTGDNGLDCEKCSKKSDAKIKTNITTVPELLILRLKRFDLDYQTFQVVKLNDYCSFPHKLDISDFYSVDDPDQSAQPKYTLKGILVHTGNADSGHYYSFIRERDSSKWFRFEDHNVTPFDPDEIPAECFGGVETVQVTNRRHPGYLVDEERDIERNALLLFYEKNESVLNQNCSQADAENAEKGTTTIEEKFDDAPDKITFCPAENVLHQTRKEVVMTNQYNSIQFYRYDPQFIAFLGYMGKDIAESIGKRVCHTRDGRCLVLKTNKAPKFLEQFAKVLSRYFLDVVMRCTPMKTHVGGCLSPKVDCVSVSELPNTAFENADMLSSFSQLIIKPARRTSAGSIFSEGLLRILEAHPFLGMNHVRMLLQRPVEPGLDGDLRLNLGIGGTVDSPEEMPRRMEEIFGDYSDEALSWIYHEHTPEGVWRVAEHDICQFVALNVPPAETWFLVGLLHCVHVENRQHFLRTALSAIRSATRSPFEFEMDDMIPDLDQQTKRMLHAVNPHVLAAASEATRDDWCWGYMSFSRDLARWKHMVRLYEYNDILEAKLRREDPNFEIMNARLLQIEFQKAYINYLRANERFTCEHLQEIKYRLGCEEKTLSRDVPQIRADYVPADMEACYKKWSVAAVRVQCPVSRLLFVWVHSISAAASLPQHMNEFFEFMTSLSKMEIESPTKTEITLEMRQTIWDETRAELSDIILKCTPEERPWRYEEFTTTIICPYHVCLAFQFLNDCVGDCADNGAANSDFLKFVSLADIVGRIGSPRWKAELNLVQKASLAFPYLHGQSQKMLETMYTRRFFLKDYQDEDEDDYFFDIVLNSTLFYARAAAKACDQWEQLPSSLKKDAWFRAKAHKVFEKLAFLLETYCHNAKSHDEVSDLYTELLFRLLNAPAFPSSLKLTAMYFVVAQRGGDVLGRVKERGYRVSVAPFVESGLRDRASKGMRTILVLLKATVGTSGYYMAPPELLIALTNNLLSYYRDVRSNATMDGFTLKDVSSALHHCDDSSSDIFLSDVKKYGGDFVCSFIPRFSDMKLYGTNWDFVMNLLSGRQRRQENLDPGDLLAFFWDRCRHQVHLPLDRIDTVTSPNFDRELLHNVIEYLRMSLLCKSLVTFHITHCASQTSLFPSTVTQVYSGNDALILIRGAGTKWVNGYYRAKGNGSVFRRYFGGILFTAQLNSNSATGERQWVISKSLPSGSEAEEKLYVITHRESPDGSSQEVGCFGGRQPGPRLREIST